MTEISFKREGEKVEEQETYLLPLDELAEGEPTVLIGHLGILSQVLEARDGLETK
jgi:hypothetical protein